MVAQTVSQWHQMLEELRDRALISMVNNLVDRLSNILDTQDPI
jgi:hypothetical protein